MIAQQTTPKQHQLSDIKPQKTNLFNPVSTMQRLNRALAEILAFDGDDLGFRDYLVNRYLQTLDIYHVNGRAGSLLPQAVLPPGGAIMAAPVVTDPKIEISLALRQLPFRPVIQCDETTVTVTLRPTIGEPVSATAVSFALAWAWALNKLKGATLVNHIDEVAR